MARLATTTRTALTVRRTTIRITTIDAVTTTALSLGAALDDPLALFRLHLRQRVQLNAFVETGAGDGGEVIAEGFAASGGEPYRALGLACGVGRCRRECVATRVAKFAGRSSSIPPVLRLRMQLLVYLLAPEDRRGFLRGGQRATDQVLVDLRKQCAR